jgi:hypothetical protein
MDKYTAGSSKNQELQVELSERRLRESAQQEAAARAAQEAEARQAELRAQLLVEKERAERGEAALRKAAAELEEARWGWQAAWHGAAGRVAGRAAVQQAGGWGRCLRAQLWSAAVAAAPVSLAAPPARRRRLANPPGPAPAPARRARLQGAEERSRKAEAEVAALRDEARGLRAAQEQAHNMNRLLVNEDLHALRNALNSMSTRLQDQGSCLGRQH